MKEDSKERLLNKEDSIERLLSKKDSKKRLLMNYDSLLKKINLGQQEQNKGKPISTRIGKLSKKTRIRFLNNLVLCSSFLLLFLI